MEIFTIIIADDHIIFRKGLRTVLNEIPFVKVIDEVSNGIELLRSMKKYPVDIIFMDINMPEMNGIEATKKITEKYTKTAVIGLTMHEEIGYFNQMNEAGATGFLLKKTTKEELEEAITTVMEGENFYSKEFISSLNITPPKKKKIDCELSNREKEVLILICKGFSNVEMAKKLNLSQKTIDGHRTHLLEKTGAKNAANLVMFALKNNLIDIN
ncbi:MAG: response regulator transcription factor [Bacteroidales bacterium]|nr:response regulator transcription factor [Bacteroidales bacterium]